MYIMECFEYFYMKSFIPVSCCLRFFFFLRKMFILINKVDNLLEII